MGFQQNLLDQMVIAFLSSIGSMAVAIIGILCSLIHPLFGLCMNFLGLSLLFPTIYKWYYCKKFGKLSKSLEWTWWILLTLTFGFSLSMPILVRELWMREHNEWLAAVIPLITFVGFEIETYKFHLHKHFYEESP